MIDSWIWFKLKLKDSFICVNGGKLLSFFAVSLFVYRGWGVGVHNTDNKGKIFLYIISVQHKKELSWINGVSKKFCQIHFTFIRRNLKNSFYRKSPKRK